ncbi:hypothetical protein M409DRAFT_19580 [Zasmidium cellare ATCC 36951]|uniref:Uncharacterized protein n=1 Tax=Zasmidium cellare ATCC 36951 TaxID=1080233 RepID=A0A6A6CSB7_ZASCE|nr:uncharacterized protein M409DRAFT_19580 [Zasmidium cellare ATCC 36951]KAF2169965.1 hypothetical protein M409DRAFT_19580 [Zasmidium cellare ATCC 36951]
MARLPTSHTPQLEAPPTNLPYKSHPIYHLRRLLLIVSLLGVFLCFISGDPYALTIFFACVFVLAVSIFFVLCDLTAYALKKAQSPDHDPQWPKIIFMVGDVILAVVLQFAFWTAIATLENRGPYYGSTTCPAYAALTPLICSILHAVSFWKELMARCEKKWLLRLSLEPCPRCGYHETAENETDQQARQPPPSNTFPYVGPSASYQPPTVTTPTVSDSMMEEGLLIGPELTKNYGAVETTEPTVGEPAEVVVGKGKKKRVVEGSVRKDDA